MQKIIFSKQSDHDLDIIPLWYHWYSNVFKADTIIITPVKTRLSSIQGVMQFYQDKPVIIAPIEIEEWEEEPIWRAQLESAKRTVRRGAPYIALSADSDQFFEPVEEVDGSEVLFQRINVISHSTPTLSTIASDEIEAYASYILIAGFVNTFETPSIWLTGHFDGAMTPRQQKLVRREYHLCLRGRDHFVRKFSTLAIKDDKTETSGGWKKLRHAYEEGGESRLEREYLQWCQWIARDRRDPKSEERFAKYLSAAVCDEDRAPAGFPFASSMVEPELALTLRGTPTRLKLAVPRHEISILQQSFKATRWIVPRLFHEAEQFTVVDIGAQYGFFARYIGALFPQAIVHCFEQFQPHFDILRINLQAISRASAYPYSLSDAQNPTTESAGNMSGLPLEIRDALTVLMEIVPDGIDLLKISSRALGLRILSRLAPLLPRVKVVMIEYHSEQERRAFDAQLGGFSLYDLTLDTLGAGVAKYMRS